MRDCGRITWPMERVASFTQGAMFMKGHGSMTKPKEKVCTFIKMGHLTLANGLTISNTDMACKSGLTEPSMKGTSKKD